MVNTNERPEKDEKKSKPFSVINVSGRSHVITPNVRMTCDHSDANYENTGQALCGVLLKGENLERWVKRTKIVEI